MQGKDNNIQQLQDKNIMKKLEDNVKPVVFQTLKPDMAELANIKSYYNSQLISDPKLAMHVIHLSNENQRLVQGQFFR